jgi:hypothetical protein
MTPWFLVSSILENILTNLANFLQHHNSILLKNINFSCGNTRLAAHVVGELFHVTSSNLSTGNSFSIQLVWIRYWIWIGFNQIPYTFQHSHTPEKQGQTKGRIDPITCRYLGKDLSNQYKYVVQPCHNQH